MAIILVMIATLLAYFNENKLEWDLGGVKKDGIYKDWRRTI